ncbi:helix-turn-helix domain-containing protein [Candidatus Marsarchaeota archaeon]|nr:helix-turn-helix domain-containing protein [Candidatus Marsarchaeota archaeon]
MTKYGLTKARIVELIGQGVDNLSDLSKMLNLAPSTVSKHLDELESSGAIRLRQEGYARKWKHYEIVKDVQEHNAMRDMDRGAYRNGTVLERIRNRIILPVVAIAIIAVLIYLFSGINQSSSLLNIPVSITDPPHVPAGTQALYINYSSFAVLVNNSGSQQWMPINSSGRINLMSIINVSDIVATLRVSPQDSISAVKFNISSASITIENVTYPVEIANGAVDAYIGTHTRLNSSSTLLVDLSPTVIPIYANGSYRFVLLPFLSAAFGTDHEYGAAIGSQMHAGMQSQPIGSRYMISDNPFYRHMNISINNPVLAVGANETSFSVNVRNTGSTGITIYGIILEEDNIGQHNSSMWAKAFNETNSSVNINASAIYIDVYGMPDQHHWTERITLTHPANMIIISGTMDGAGPFGAFMQWHIPRCMDFSAENNGTLELVASPFHIYNNGLTNAGYLLPPFSNETFMYEGKSFDHFNNVSYEVLVLTNKGVASGSFSGNTTGVI